MTRAVESGYLSHYLEILGRIIGGIEGSSLSDKEGCALMSKEDVNVLSYLP